MLGTFDKGEVVKIRNSSVMEGQNVEPDSVTVTITDPEGTVRVDAETMSKGASEYSQAKDETATEYSYLFQSSDAMPSGYYDIECEATSGTYVSIKKKRFSLV